MDFSDDEFYQFCLQLSPTEIDAALQHLSLPQGGSNAEMLQDYDEPSHSSSSGYFLGDGADFSGDGTGIPYSGTWESHWQPPMTGGTGPGPMNSMASTALGQFVDMYTDDMDSSGWEPNSSSVPHSDADSNILAAATTSDSKVLALTTTDQTLAWGHLQETDPLWEKILRKADEHGYAAVIMNVFPSLDDITVDGLIHQGITSFLTHNPQLSRQSIEYQLDSRMRRLISNQFSHHRTAQLMDIDQFIFRPTRGSPKSGSRHPPCLGFHKDPKTQAQMEENRKLSQFALSVPNYPFMSYQSTGSFRDFHKVPEAKKQYSPFRGTVYLASVQHFAGVAKFPELWGNPNIIGLDVCRHVVILMLHKIRKIRFPKYEFSYLNYQNDIVNVTSSLTALDSSDDYTQVRKDMRASVTAMRPLDLHVLQTNIPIPAATQRILRPVRRTKSWDMPVSAFAYKVDLHPNFCNM